MRSIGNIYNRLAPQNRRAGLGEITIRSWVSYGTRRLLIVVGRISAYQMKRNGRRPAAGLAQLRSYFLGELTLPPAGMSSNCLIILMKWAPNPIMSAR